VGTGDLRGVLLDWRGTLVVAPTYPWLVGTALERVGRPSDPEAVEEVLARLRSADAGEVESSGIDTDADLHRAAHLRWFGAAGLDPELTEALYATESDVTLNPFAEDVADLLEGLRRADVRVGVVSDIHVDLRPVFAGRRLTDGTPWAALVDAWVLSFEVGVAKPDPRIFGIALDRVGLQAREVLMVGDRAGWDGAATDLGMTTLLLPPLTHPGERRLHRVLQLLTAR
jgi:FMN phosphatase YigB (HAD superfamily)